MRIDWKAIAEMPVGRLVILPKLDWADPTHAPCMLDRIVESMGNDMDSLCMHATPAWVDQALSLIIDLMPQGKEAIREGVEEFIRDVAAAEGWADALYMPGTKEYPGVGGDEDEGEDDW